ncbi:ABC transporter substrate-binding protein [Geoglobus acetivorans]
MTLRNCVIALIIMGLMLPLAAAEEIKIGVMVDLSGPLTTYGNDIKNTLQIAKEDINNYFKEKGMDYTVEFYVEDTKVDPNVALQKIQSLNSKGIKLVIGPMGSGEVANIKDYVTSNKIIIVSPSSTALPTIIGFAKPEDKKFIFRFVGTDDLQSKAIASELRDAGVKGVVITYIGNAWGKGLYEEIKPQLEELGIEVAKVVEYPDQVPADFSPYITSLEEGVKALADKYGYDKVAVVTFSYEEVYTMLAQVPDESPLLGVVWFGCDGNALSDKTVNVKDKVTKVGTFSTLFESRGPAYDDLAVKYKEAGYGDSPYQYAMNAYDAAWVLALAYAEVVKEKGQYDPDAMAEKMPVVTEKYSNGDYGVEPVSGKIVLNEWNDRASGDYAIYYVNKEGKWETAGIWKFATQSVDWQHKPVWPEAPAKKSESTPGFEIVAGILGIALAIGLRRRL